jgi:hypothetical protein
MSKGYAHQRMVLEAALQAGGTVYVSLHTAAPDLADQTVNEADYAGYARVAVARTEAGWAITGGVTEPASAANVGDILFPDQTGAEATYSHVAIGLEATGPSTVLYADPLLANLVPRPGDTVRLRAGLLIANET